MQIENYRRKVMGCWLGKAVGGTLGQPYEGCNGPLNLSYYEPVPSDMIPNDDLDLQVLWAYILKEMPIPMVDRNTFADAWLKHVNFPWDEYGIAIRNLRSGIYPPYSGIYDNWFKDGLGAAIRSEIWACLAAGNPELAAKFAYEDACVDHAENGIYAEQFLAALESAAFIESDINKLLDIGLSVIPADSRLAQAVTDTREWCRRDNDWLRIRSQIIDTWGSENFTDCVMNLSFAVMSLLLGESDFSKTICMSVNCGLDADCTTATVGAILGIINPDGIEDKWLKPIGRKLVINEGITGIEHPDTLDEFTDLIIELRERVKLCEIKDFSEKPDLAAFKIQAETGIFNNWFSQDSERFKPRLPENISLLEFPGHCGSIPASKVPEDCLFMMRFKFNLKKKQCVRIMFNTPSNSRVWIDGDYIFGREGGRMAPSIHRAPVNQFSDIELDAGDHEFIAGVAPSNGEKEISWSLGIGDIKSKQWLPGVWSSPL